MRKVKRQTTTKRAWEIFDESNYGILSMSDGFIPYAVPISPARIDETIYIHCALEGEKIEILKKNPHVQLTNVGYVEISGPKLTTFFESSILKGKAKIVEDEHEKIEALKAIGKRYAPLERDAMIKSIERSLQFTCIIRIDVEEITGKFNHNI